MRKLFNFFLSFFKDQQLNNFENKFSFLEDSLEIRKESLIKEFNEFEEKIKEQINELEKSLIRGKKKNRIRISQNYPKLIHVGLLIFNISIFTPDFSKIVQPNQNLRRMSKEQFFEYLYKN